MDIEVTNDTPTNDGSSLQTEVSFSLRASSMSVSQISSSLAHKIGMQLSTHA